MKIFKNIKNSIYSPKFYKELLEKPFSFSFKYFAIFALTISLFVTIIFSVIYIPGIKFFIDEFGYNVIDYYPEELQVTIKNGQVFTNVQEPYFIQVIIASRMKRLQTARTTHHIRGWGYWCRKNLR